MKTLIRTCLIIFALICVLKNAGANTLATVLKDAKAGKLNTTISGVSSNANLSLLKLSPAATLMLSSGPSNVNYVTSVVASTTSVTVTPTTADINATIKVNGVTVISGSPSAPIPLNAAGATTINLLVTAQDGITTRSYAITISKNGSGDASLKLLTLSTGSTLTQVSGPSNVNYAASVASGVTSVKVTPATTDANATVTVNGTPVTSGSASASIPLNATGTTTINLLVTAQDVATTRSYAITISKNGSGDASLKLLTLSTGSTLTQVSGPSNVNYAASVASGVTSVTVTPATTDANASVTVNGTPVISGSASASIPLNATGTTTINFLVTAQDGVTTRTYAITISKNGSGDASLKLLTLNTGSTLTQVSGPSNVNYTTSVASGITSVMVTPTTTDANATVTVNGDPVVSGSASAFIPLNATGTTTINLLVTAQDGATTMSYAITISKNGSGDASLKLLTLSTGSSLTQVSGPSNVNYTASVASGVTSVTVTPTTTDANATVTVNGNTVLSGASSASIPLNATGTTTIDLLVTAQDGATTRSYAITISKNGSGDASLKLLTLSTGSTLTQVSGPSNVNYFASVNSAVTSVTVTPTTTDAGATVTVNGTPVLSGSASASIPLNATGTTTIDLLVTAQDGLTTRSYAITISKNGSGDASLKLLTLSTGSTLTQVSGPSNVNYTASVPSGTTSLTVTPTTTDANAVVTVNGVPVASGTASGLIALNATGTTTVNLLVTAEDGTTTRSFSITISKTGVSTNYAWTGAGPDGNWGNVANWSPQGVPVAGDIASIGLIAFTGSKQPVIVSPVTVDQIVIGTFNTPVITVSAGQKLTVVTALTVNNNATGTVNASGGAAFVDIAPEGIVSVGTSGVLNINSPLSFTLKSDETGSASMAQISPSSIAGTAAGSINVERYITGGSNLYRGYRLLSSPVYKATANGNNIFSLNYVQLSSPVTGTNSAGGFDRVGNPSLYLFREDRTPNNSSFITGNYRGVNNLTTDPDYYIDLDGGPFNLPVGTGFLFFFRGDRTNIASKFVSSTVAESVTMTSTGKLNAGPVTVHNWYNPTSANLGYTNTTGNGGIQGFNLVGNPYASSIDWDTYNTSTPNSGIYAPNVSSSIFELDPVSKNYGVYQQSTGFGTNNASNIIVSGQGFFVQALDPTASLTFNEDAKTSVQLIKPNLLLGTPVVTNVKQYLHLKLSQGDAPVDELFINFNRSAKPQFNMSEDALYKPGTGVASLSSLSSEGLALSINALPLLQQNAIPLSINADADGKYILNMQEIKSIPKLYDVWLKDAYKKDSVNLRSNAIYNFSIAKGDPASFGPKRFAIVVKQNPAYAYHLLDFAGTKINAGVQLVWKTQNEGNYTRFTIERSVDNGKTFDVIGSASAADQGAYHVIDRNPVTGLNQYRLKQEDINGAISYSKVVFLQYSNTLDNRLVNNVSIYPNPVANSLNLVIKPTDKTASFDIKVVNNLGAVVKSGTTSQNSWQSDVAALLPGTYILQVLSGSDKSIVGKTTFVKL